jgi:hypothetical protein
MIALRGKLERGDTGRDDVSETPTWKWKGHWAFGTKLLEKGSTKALPFEYSWKRFVDPKTVEVPSYAFAATETVEADQVEPQEDEKMEDIESTGPEETTATAEKAESKDQGVDTATPAKEATSAETKTATNDIPPETPSKQTTTTTTTTTTFADTTLPDDPPFTDASINHATLCPPSGEWTGHFQTIGARKNTTIPVTETFCLFLNATPCADARIAFTDDDHPDPAAQDAATMLPVGHIQARGIGENQYGTFELLGHLDLETGILECQRMYVATTTAAAAAVGTDTTVSTVTPRRTMSRGGAGRSRSRSTKSRTGTGTGTGGSGGERSYVTRKRQLSWKRRAAMEETDVEAKARRSSMASTTGSTGTGTTSAGGSGGRSGKKRARMDPMVTGGDTGVEPISSTGGVPDSTMAPPMSITFPGATQLPATAPGPATTAETEAAAVTKRSQTSPFAPAAAKKRVPAGNTGGSTNRHRNSSGGGTGGGHAGSSSSSSSGHMKLPAAGTPSHARWRAAHFLYYQRNDPSLEDGNHAASSGGGGGTTISGGTGSSSNVPPRYVVYEGELLNSMREGKGVCLYNNGMMYEGEWKRNKEHGHGVLRSDRKRIIYKGEWERGRMHGHGTYYYSSPKDERSNKNEKGGGGGGGSSKKLQSVPVGGGSRYEGDFKENLRHGTGTYVLPDGSVYAGQWREGLMSGRGVFTWPDGAVYDGEWKDRKRHGLGLLKTADGFSYDGMWVHNSMEGRGSAVYPNGQQYNGLFSNGRREGRGTILFPNGAVYEGRFRDDEVDGQGTMKMHRTLVVPRTIDTDTTDDDGGDASMNANVEDTKDFKDDFMIPLYFQSDIGHIHRKAGFTGIGE